MRLPDDDEIYDVDQTYLGPPGYFVGRFRYRSLFLAPGLFLVGLVLVARTVGYSVLSVGLLAVVVAWLTKKIVDWTSSERPLGVVAAVAVHEVNARRAERSTVRVRGPSLKPSRVRLGRNVVAVGRRGSHRKASAVHVDDWGFPESTSHDDGGPTLQDVSREEMLRTCGGCVR